MSGFPFHRTDRDGAGGGEPSGAAAYPEPPAFPPHVPHTPHAPHAASGAPDGGRRRLRGRSPGVLLAAVAVIAAAVGGGGALGVQALTEHGSSTVAAGSVQGSTVAASGKGTVAEVAEAVTPSVVEISAQTAGGESTGSGVVVSEDGGILTNNHVVSGADTVQVTFSNGKKARAQLEGASPDHDLALVKAQNTGGLTPARLGDSDEVGVGEQVVAIGSPGGLSGTVTSGIVSAKDREVTVQKEDDGGDSRPGQGGSTWPFEFGGGRYNGDVGDSTTTYKALQTDASLNPGNSGGALVDLRGNVIGINSAMYSAHSGDQGSGGSDGSVGLGFAIPVNDVKDLLDGLRSGGN